jgi:glycosyltransferase involved in cell wall biosynthesis
MEADMKILVLHSRLSGYWMACMRTFVEQYGGTFFVVRKEISENAPFEFQDEEGIRLFPFSSFSGQELTDFAEDIDPDLVYTAGWEEQHYLKIAKRFYKQGNPVLCGMDNHWTGNLRQRAGKFYLRNLLPNSFTHIWIPGLYQYDFARRLGFSKEQILTCLYSADVSAFSRADKNGRGEAFPKSLLYVGRFIKQKGLMELAQAFQRFKDTSGSPWSLTLIGNGPLKEKLQTFDAIQIHDFVQPENLPEVMSKHGVFLLPSRYEEGWGVVIHEAAAAGLPIISTYQCGAARAFIREGYNGYLVKSGSIQSLHHALNEVTELSDQELRDMSERSRELSKQITPHTWASILHQTIVDNTQ